MPKFFIYSNRIAKTNYKLGVFLILSIFLLGPSYTGAVTLPTQQEILEESTMSDNYNFGPIDTDQAFTNADEAMGDLEENQEHLFDSKGFASIGGERLVVFDISIQPVFREINGFLQFSLILALLFISFLLLFIIYKAHKRAKINKINKTNKSYEKKYYF